MNQGDTAAEENGVGLPKGACRPTVGGALVSIVVTAYNSGEMIGQTLQSACAQSWTNKEIIVVDDGSKPECAASIARAVGKFSSIRLVRESNRGLSGARNRGVELGTGAYVGFLDHDDLWRPRLVERLIAPLEADPALGLVFCRIEHMRENGTPTGRISHPKLHGLTVRDLLISDPACCGSSFMVRRTAYQQVGGFAEDFRRAETPEFFIRLVLAGWKIEGIADVLVLYRNTAGGLSMKAGALLQDRLRILRNTLPRCPELGRGISIQLLLRWTEFKNRLRKFIIG